MIARVVTLNPRKRFQEDKTAASFHADLVASDRFVKAAEAALLQCMADLPKTTGSDVAACAANYHRIEGAKEYLNRFYGLTAADPPPRAIPSDNP